MEGGGEVLHLRLRRENNAQRRMARGRGYMRGEWHERDRNPMSFLASMAAVNGANGVNGGVVTLTLPHARAVPPACTSLPPREPGPEKTPMELAFGEPGSATTFAPRRPGPGA
jgi:hypothetical protein